MSDQEPREHADVILASLGDTPFLTDQAVLARWQAACASLAALVAGLAAERERAARLERESKTLRNEVARLSSGSEIPALRQMVSAQYDEIKAADDRAARLQERRVELWEACYDLQARADRAVTGRERERSGRLAAEARADKLTRALEEIRDRRYPAYYEEARRIARVALAAVDEEPRAASDTETPA